MKTCTKCLTAKPLDQFYSDKKLKSGKRSSCISCMNAATKSYYRDNGDKVRAQHKNRYSKDPSYRRKVALDRRRHKLKSLYGITPSEYDHLFDLQNGVCAICGNPEKLAHGTLAVDHDHETGKVRGLLCFNCNASLGKLEGHIESLKAYLERSG